jgi:pectate lyase
MVRLTPVSPETFREFDSTCTVPYSYTLDSSANIPAIVTGNAGVGKIAP